MRYRVSYGVPDFRPLEFLRVDRHPGCLVDDAGDHQADRAGVGREGAQLLHGGQRLVDDDVRALLARGVPTTHLADLRGGVERDALHRGAADVESDDRRLVTKITVDFYRVVCRHACKGTPTGVQSIS